MVTTAEPNSADWAIHIREPWAVMVNTLTDSWCVVLREEEKTPAEGGVVVADFASEDDAKHIARIHNEWLQHAKTITAGREPDIDRSTNASPH